MGASSSSTHAMQDVLGSASELYPPQLIDESIFEDDLGFVMAGILYWQTMRQPGEERRSPFKRWPASGSPVNDLSWIGLGYNFVQHVWTGHSYEYKMDDNGATSGRAARLYAETGNLLRIPNYAKRVTEVVRHALSLMTRHEFPYAPMIAHHWMIGGEFSERDGWAEPNFILGNTSLSYEQVGIDFMDGVDRLLRLAADFCLPSRIIEVPRMPGFMDGQFERNLKTLRDAFPILVDRKFKYPNGLVPFWQSDVIMNYYILWREGIHQFSNDELVKSPGSDDWYVVYCNMFVEYFIIFQREAAPITGQPIVTMWKIDGQLTQLADDGDLMYIANAKLRTHFRVEGDWLSMEFLKETWWPGQSLVCGSPQTSLKFPMVLDLVADRGPHQYPRRNQLVRCTSIPDSIHQAVTYTGRGQRDPTTDTWVPMHKINKD